MQSYQATLTSFHHRSSAILNESNNLQTQNRLNILIEQSHFHDVEKLNLVHLHEYQNSFQAFLKTSQSIQCASQVFPSPMASPMMVPQALHFSIKQNLMDQLLPDPLKFLILGPNHQELC